MALLLALLSTPAQPYGFQYADKEGKQPLKWRTQKIRLFVSESLTGNSAAVAGQDILLTVRRAASAWAAAGAPEIVIVPGSDDSVSSRAAGGDGVSLLTSAATPENVLLFSGANSSRPAVTRLFFDRRGGITEADIALNPFYSHSTNGFPGSFDLETTLIHEFGHLLGLGHSDLPGASMYELSARNGLFGMPFSLQRTLSSDDVAGARALYGAAAAGGGCCEVVRGNVGVASATGADWLVWAEDGLSGEVVSSVAAPKDGAFEMTAVDARPLKLFARAVDSAAPAVVSVGDFDPNSKGLGPVAGEQKPAGEGGRIEGVGINGELSELAIPLNQGNTYRIYVAVAGWTGGSRFSVSSPLIEIDDASYEITGYGDGLTVASFLVSVGDSVPDGLYTVRLEGEKGLLDLLPGAISVGPEINPWIFHPEAVQRR